MSYLATGIAAVLGVATLSHDTNALLMYDLLDRWTEACNPIAIPLLLDRVWPPRETQPTLVEPPPIYDAGGGAVAQQDALRCASI